MINAAIAAMQKTTFFFINLKTFKTSPILKKLQPGHYITNIKDFKEVVEPSVYEVLEEYINQEVSKNIDLELNDVEDNNYDLECEINDLEEECDDLRDRLKDKSNELYGLKVKILDIVKQMYNNEISQEDILYELEKISKWA